MIFRSISVRVLKDDEESTTVSPVASEKLLELRLVSVFAPVSSEPVRSERLARRIRLSLLPVLAVQKVQESCSSNSSVPPNFVSRAACSNVCF